MENTQGRMEGKRKEEGKKWVQKLEQVSFHTPKKMVATKKQQFSIDLPVSSCAAVPLICVAILAFSDDPARSDMPICDLGYVILN